MCGGDVIENDEWLEYGRVLGRAVELRVERIELKKIGISLP